jgi:hypothetical protein
MFSGIQERDLQSEPMQRDSLCASTRIFEQFLAMPFHRG